MMEIKNGGTCQIGITGKGSSAGKTALTPAENDTKN